MEIQGPSGRKLYKEEVNDFRVIALTFGRSNYIWNQLVDIYNDWGALDKGGMRIKRTGTGMYDTSYTLAATARGEEIPADKLTEIDDLPTIKGYFSERYSGTPAQSLNGSASAEVVNLTTDKENLFS